MLLKKKSEVIYGTGGATSAGGTAALVVRRLRARTRERDMEVPKVVSPEA